VCKKSSSGLRHRAHAADEGFVAVFPRLAGPRRDRVVSASRWAVSLAGAFAAALVLFPAAAGAVVTEVGETKAGVNPRDSSTIVDALVLGDETNSFFYNPAPETFANPAGHPVVHNAQVYAIYWDPGLPETKTNYYHGDWATVIDTFLHDVNAENGSLGDVFSVDTQYTDTSNKPASGGLTFHGAYVDDAKYPSSGCEDPRPLYEEPTSKVRPLACLTDAQVRTELQNFVALHSLPKGMNTIYYVLTPPGLTVCLDAGSETGHCSDYGASLEEQLNEKYESESYEHSFCSYHGDINPGGLPTGDGNTILYGMIPWTAGAVGDGQVAAPDQSEAFPCQDGGFDPSSKPTEKHEEVKPLSAEEESQYKALKSVPAKEAFIRFREPAGPHVEEPNQDRCPTRDGYCDQGLADLIANQIAVQEHDIVTDPLLNGWKDGAQNEASDECHNFFAPALGGSSSLQEGSGAGTLFNQTLASDNYYLNTAFDLAALKLNYPGVPCLPGLRLEPKFTAPSPVNAEETVAFNGMESDITLNANSLYNGKGEEQPNYATYSWSFGDGSPAVTGYAPGAPTCEAPWLSPCAGSVFHAYKYGGTYEVVLTVTDVGGNTARTSQMVSVLGPPPPSGTGSGTSGGPGSGSGSGSGAVHNPVVNEFVLSKSLRKALRKGLSVRYSVSEQVAGRFEVLISNSLARRFHLSGAPAGGLAPGTPAQTIVGKAILVTTRGGAGTMTISFGKKTSARLRHLGRVTFLVRLLVHNAQGRTATVLATVTLAG
jgi:PKD domain